MSVEDVMEDAELKMMKSVDVVKSEFASIRTGKASPALVEGKWYFRTQQHLICIGSAGN